MAKTVLEITLGVDVSKDELVICDWQSEQIIHLANEAAEISQYLNALYGPVRLAIEPTSSYHLALVEQAHALDHTVYLINPRQLVHYRKAVSVRNKTDPADAWLLARYLAHESVALRAFKPQCAKAQRLWALLKRRGVAVRARQTLKQSFREIRLPAKALFTEIQRVIARIDQRIRALVHESGKYKGQRKLTKCGEAEVRRLLFCAAQGARAYPCFERYLQLQLDKGLSKIAAKVTLARKLARIAFTLISKQQSFKKQEIIYSQSP